MPRPLPQSLQTHPASPIYAPEPDVPWEIGGIDDWGWQAEDQLPSSAIVRRAHATTSPANPRPKPQP